MHSALNKTLAALPDDTKVYVSAPLPTYWCAIERRIVHVLTQQFQPGHEYTKSNVRFALSILQSEPVRRLQKFAEENKETQGRFTIGDEKVSK